MNLKYSFIILYIFSAYFGIAKAAGTDTTKNKQFPCKFELPNDQWNLVVDNPPAQYLFKRNPITNSTGAQIVPVIMLYSEDATNYAGNIAIFSSKKMQPFLNRGVRVPRILSWHEKEYPLIFKNALFMRGEYSSKDVEHIIYMIYIIDKYNHGIQVYLDMTKDIAPQYENEFLKTIKSLRELP